MMETFLVLGLCFILYEALDFFQGCIHSATPSASDQIDAYRRQLDEQRQKQQEEQFLANLTPLLSAQLAAAGFTFSTSTNSTVSTASVISDLKLQVAQRVESESHSVSTPALNGTSGGGFRPAYNSIYETQLLQGSSSLPRDYYYLQQQQLKNKTSSKSILSRFSSNSDNRIHPENSALPTLPTGVITTQPTLQNCRHTLDTETPIITVPPTSSVLAVELKRAILSNNNNNSCSKDSKTLTHHKSNQSLNSQSHESTSSEEDEDAETSDSDSSTAGSASLNSGAFSSDHELADERTFTLGSCSSSSHTDFREIECERMRRQCVSVKRIYSISEKF